MRWISIDGTTWPVDDEELEWSLRYNAGSLGRDKMLSAASVLAAYRHLTDPNVSQTDAIAALKRARLAHKGAAR